MKRVFIFLAFLLAATVAAKAGPVDVNRAKQVGAKFVNANTDLRASAQDLRLASTFRTTDGVAAFHVFNLPQGGSVIVAADDCATPILGYSERRQFDENNVPPAMQDYLESFVEQIEYGITNRIRATNSIAHQWELVETTGRLIDDRASNTYIAPLLTSEWGQGLESGSGHFYYNYYCPEDPEGANGHAKTGCVATAMSQIMYFWKWPIQGNGSRGYLAPGYGWQEANFGGTYYSWSNMVDKLDFHVGNPNLHDLTVALLMYHCGVAVNAFYGPDETGASSLYVESAFKDYFRYSSDAKYELKSTDSNTTWLAKIRADLNCGRPIYYDGFNGFFGNGGHAFVCDGVDTQNFLHFNWGWDGSTNFEYWCALDALEPGQGLSYNWHNGAVFHLHPDQPVNHTVTTQADSQAGGTVDDYYYQINPTTLLPEQVHHPSNYSHGTRCYLTATPSTGYYFLNWTKEDGQVVSTDATFYFDVIRDVHYIANFMPTTYNITTSASPSAGGTTTGGSHYTYGSNCTITATPSTGYHFVNWKKNGTVVSTNSTYTFTVTEDAIYVATFAKNTFTITTTSNPSAGGSTTGGGNYSYNSVCNLHATPNTSAGYHFVNWTNQNGTVITTNPDVGISVTQNATFTANFARNDYNVSATVYPTGGGSVTGAGNYTHGATCTLTATPSQHYQFVLWLKNGNLVSTSPTYSFTVTESCNFTAAFSTATYFIGASANPSAGGSVDGWGNYDYNEQCTLTATPNSGYSFINWTKNGTVVSEYPTYTFTVTEAASYVANFGPNSYYVFAHATPYGSGTVTGTNNYPFGSTVTLTATPNEGYHFYKWTLNDEEVSTNPTYTFTMPAYSMHLYAHFESAITLDTYSLEFDEFGSSTIVNVPITIGEHLQGTPTLSGDPDWITAGISSDHTRLAMMVSPNPSTESRTCSLVVSVGGYNSQPLVITQSGQSPASFELSEPFVSLACDDQSWHTEQIINVSHVASPIASHVNIGLIDDGYGTDWIELRSLNANDLSFRFRLSDYTSGFYYRSVLIRVTITGTDGTAVAHNVTVYQNPPGASMAVEPNEWDLGIIPMCVPQTETFTVSYQNANPELYSHIWLEPEDDYYFGTLEITPDHYDLDPSGTGTATFTVTYTTASVFNEWIKLHGHLGSYGEHDGVISTPASLTAVGLHPYDINEKVTSEEMLLSGPADEWYIWDESTSQFTDTVRLIRTSLTSENLLVQAGMLVYDYELGNYISSDEFNPQWVSNQCPVIPLSDGTYIIRLQGASLAWDDEQHLHEGFVPMNTPDDLANIPDKFKWTIAFDGDGNAIIRPNAAQNYSLRCVSEMVPSIENPEETMLEYHFVCITEGGTPVQIFRHIDGELPEPVITPDTQYFLDGESLTFTITPTENMGVVYSLNDGDYQYITEPITLTVSETTKVSASSYMLCETDPWPGQIEYTYYKINTIAEARANANTEYYIHGIVSCADHVHGRYFVQDETGGIEIAIDWSIYEGYSFNHDSLVALQDGDEIVLKGWYDSDYNWFTGQTTDWNYGGAPIFNEPTLAKLSEGNTVEPLVVTFDDLYETTDVQYMARLVKLVNLTVSSGSEWPNAYIISNGEDWMTFPDEMENPPLDEYMMPEKIQLENGQVIDLTAIWLNYEFNNPKEVAVKTGHTITMQAYSDEAFSTPSSALNNQIIYCDENGNAQTPGSIYSETMVYFTIGSGYHVGLNNAQHPVAAVCNATTGEVIYDSYDNLLLEAHDMAGVPNRLFAFTMPDVDVTIKVWLEEFVMNYYITTTASPMEGGTVTGGGNYAEGSTCTLTATANTDYAFVNWTTANGEVVSTGTTYSFIVTDYAMFVANFVSTATYTITTTANPTEGGCVEGAGVYTVGETCTLTASANANYTFINWTKNGEAVTTDAVCSFIVTENADYVANFMLNSYAIGVSTNPSEGGNVSGEGTYNHGATVTLTATANQGYSFANWTKNGNVVSTSATYTFTATESAIYVANFGPSACTVTATTNPTNGGTVEGTGTYDYGTVVTLTANANAGYSFANWTQDGTVVSTDALYSFTVNGNTTLVANFTLSTYTVTVFANPTNAGTVTGGGEYTAGESCTLSATTNIGFNFIGWMSANGTTVSTEATYTFTVNSNSMFVANYEEVAVNHFTITATANPVEGGNVYDVGSYAEGETCTLTASAYPGYTFVNWTRDGQVVSTEIAYSFIVTEDADFVANFNGQSVYFTITATADPAEGGTVSGGDSYPYGSTCTLTATANAGYNFVGWANTEGEIVLYDMSFDFQVFDDLTLVAHFEAISGEYHTITASATPAVGGTVSGEGSYPEGSTCTLTATANTGYTFVNWTENGTEVSTDATYSFEVTGERTLVASFEVTVITQTIALTEGENWVSFYVETTLDDLKAALVSASNNASGIKITSQSSGYTIWNGSTWRGSLTFNPSQMYVIEVPSAREITLVAMPIDPAEHPITIVKGINWIGFPLSTSMSLNNAFAGFAQSGDKIYSKDGYATYQNGSWSGNLSNLQPGQGFKYYSASAMPKTLVFSLGRK